MAIDCVAAFDTQPVIQLRAGSPVSGTVADRFSGAFYKFEMLEFESVSFTLNVNPKTSNPINVIFTLYRKDGEEYTNLGNSISDDFYNTFDYAAEPAEYYVCITTDWGVDFTLTGEFTDFPFVALAETNAYAGEWMPVTDISPSKSVCETPVFYEIVEGSLPLGLEFNTGSGIIYGVPEEQDCDPKLADAPPSFSWFEEDEFGNMQAKGWKHRVVIRAMLVDAPETYVDREFFICVQNNWDDDLENITQQVDKLETPVFVVEGDEPWLQQAEPEPELELVTDELCPCPEEEPKSATLEEIKQLTKQMYIAPEFVDLVKVNSDGLCEVCEPISTEQIDSVVESGLREIEMICIPCPEPVQIEFTMEDPTLCPCPVAEVIEIESPVKYVPSIPEVCDLYGRMLVEKNCPPVSCGTGEPIYPMVQKEEEKLPLTMCPKECE